MKIRFILRFGCLAPTGKWFQSLPPPSQSTRTGLLHHYAHLMVGNSSKIISQFFFSQDKFLQFSSASLSPTVYCHPLGPSWPVSD